jgi:Tfp pilus assembly protein PilO
MSKLPKDKRDKIILIAMGTLVASAALWFFLISSQQTSLKKVRDEATKSREQLEAGQKTVKSQSEVKQEFEEASLALKQREAAMASPNDMYLWHIETLNRFRMNYNVEIPQFGREVMADVGCFPKFPYRAAIFSVRGTAYYHDLGKFLADFENAFPYVRVQNIQMEPYTSDTSASPREKLVFKIELLTLVRPNAI